MSRKMGLHRSLRKANTHEVQVPTYCSYYRNRILNLPLIPSGSSPFSESTHTIALSLYQPGSIYYCNGFGVSPYVRVHSSVPRPFCWINRFISSQQLPKAQFFPRIPLGHASMVYPFGSSRSTWLDSEDEDSVQKRGFIWWRKSPDYECAGHTIHL